MARKPRTAAPTPAADPSAIITTPARARGSAAARRKIRERVRLARAKALIAKAEANGAASTNGHSRLTKVPRHVEDPMHRGISDASTRLVFVRDAIEIATSATPAALQSLTTMFGLLRGTTRT